MSLIATQDYSDPDQMLANYARIRRLFRTPHREPVKLVVVEAVPEPEPTPPIDPLALYRLAYDNAIDKNTDIQVAHRIISDTAAEFGLSTTMLKGPCRQKAVARARQFAMWRIAKQTGLSTTRIGWLLGDRDHTTAIHAIRRVNGIMSENVRGTGLVTKGRSACSPS